jgi:methyltransferase (TIGR00027 family)
VVSNGNIPQGVGQTAIGVAKIRARESERADRLFHDPYAGAFVDAAPGAPVDAGPGAPAEAAPGAPVDAGPGAPAEAAPGALADAAPEAPVDAGPEALADAAPGAPVDAGPDALVDAALGATVPRQASGEPTALGAIFQARVVIRTRFYDDYLLAACAAGCRQVVLLAAGMDTRGYRLDWPPGTRLFEIDQPDVLAFKDAVLTTRDAVPRCHRVARAADLRQNWAAVLLDSGLRPSERTAWLAEGLLIYLTAEEVEQLFATITGLSAPGSTIAFEYTDYLSDDAGTSPISHARTMPGMSRITALWKGGLGAETPDWLGRHGWQIQTHSIGPVAASYHRSIPGRASGGFLTATRGEAT